MDLLFWLGDSDHDSTQDNKEVKEVTLQFLNSCLLLFVTGYYFITLGPSPQMAVS